MSRPFRINTAGLPRRWLGSLRRSPIGAAGNIAIEFALIAPVLVLLLVNAVDFSKLIWSRMQLNNAAQVGAQAAYVTCAPYMPSSISPPADVNCTGMSSAVTTAAQSTALGNAVSATIGENYYYTNTSTTPPSFASVTTQPPSAMPSDCSSLGGGYSGQTPGDFITVTATYAYAPMFSGLSLASAQTLSATGMQRLE